MEKNRLRSVMAFFGLGDARRQAEQNAFKDANGANPFHDDQTPAFTTAPDVAAHEHEAQAGTPVPAPQPVQHNAVAFYGVSDAGLKRGNNEDHFIIADLAHHTIAVNDNVMVPGHAYYDIEAAGALLAVADGLGGHDDGEVASLITVEAIVQTLFAINGQELSAAERLLQAVQEAHRSIGRYIGSVPGSRSMSSTLTAVHVSQDEITIAQVGDSRAYVFSNGVLTQLTEDQTIVQMMLKKGMLTEEEADNHPDRHVILQALGQGRAITPEIESYSFQHGDCLLLCSDGLSSYVAHEDIEAILTQYPNENECCQRLLDAALEVGGHDNVTILIARLMTPQPA